MNRQNYLEMLIAFLTRLKNETGFNLETPLDHSSRIKLAAIANSADNMGENEIGKMIKKALSSNDPKTQEILLYSGISQGPLSDKDIPSALSIASNKLQAMGGSPDIIASQAVEEPESMDMPSTSDDGTDPLTDLLGGDDEASSSDDGGDPLADLLGDEEPSESSEEGGDTESSDGEEEKDEENTDDEEVDGRIAKEGDDDEEESVPEPSPMNDWFIRFVLD